MASPLVQKYEQEASEFRNLEKELNNLANTRAQLLTQLNENEMVKKELDLLGSESTVYKLIGPVLIKQDRSEAQSNVGKRIDFISSELSQPKKLIPFRKRLENSYKDTETKATEKRGRVMELQAAIQRPAVKA